MKKVFSFSIFFLFSIFFSDLVYASAKVDLDSVPQKSQANKAQEKKVVKVESTASEIKKSDIENQVVVYYNMQDLAEKLDISFDFKKELEVEFDGRSKELEKDIDELRELYRNIFRI